MTAKPLPALLCLLLPVALHAAALTWDADPATPGAQDGAGTWDGAGTNWFDGTANTNWNSATPDSASFGATNGAAGLIAISGEQAVGSLTFNAAGSGAYVLSGGSLTGALSLVARAGGAVAISNGSVSLAASAAGVFGVGYGAAGTGAVTVRAGGVLSVGNGGGRTFIGGGPSGGPYGVGVLTVEGGEVRVGPAGVNPNDNIYFNGFGGTSTSTLNLAGGAFVTARVLTMGSANPGVINWNGGILRAATNSGNLVSVTTVNVLGGGAIFDDGGFAVTIGSALQHGAGPTDGGLTKIGAGTLTLTGQHTYQGPTVVSNGTLVLAGGSAVPLLPPSNTITVASGATLRFGRHDAFGIHSITSSPAITVNAGGIMASLNTFTALWNPTLNGGTIQANGGANANYPAFQLAGTLTVGGGQASSITAATNAFSAVCVGGMSNGTLVVNVADATADASPDLTISAPLQNNQASLTGTLQKTGSGTLVLAATNTYTGSTLAQGGTLRLAAGGALLNAGSVNAISGGVLEVEGTITQAANKYFATGSGLAGTTGSTIIQTGAVLNLGGNAVVVGGGLNNGANYGAGTLTVNGGVVNVGAGVSGGGVDATTVWINPYGGAVTSTIALNGGVFSTARAIADGGSGRSRVNFNGGTLRAAANHANFLAVTKADLQAGGAILDTQGFTVTVFQAFSGVGALTKTGSGVLTLAGSNVHAGATVVSGGTLALGTINSLSPLSALTLAHGTTLSAGTNRQTVNSLTLGLNPTDAVTVVFAGNAAGLPGYYTVTNVDGLAVTGAVTVRLTGSLPPVGATNLLFAYAGTATGITNLSVERPAPRAQFVITNDAAAGRVELILTDLGQLRWVGNLTNGWELSGSTNWVLNNVGSPAGFSNGDYVIFGDAASNFVVQVAEPVQAGTVMVNATNRYTFQGAAVTSAGDLQMVGTGTTLIQNAQTCAAALFTNGLVVVGDGGTNGSLSSAGAVVNHGTLVFDRTDAVTSSLQVAGGGAWVKQGLGTLSLTGSLSSYRGDASLLQGAVIVRAPQLGANPTNSALGNPQVAGRQVLVSTNSLLAFAQHDAFGNAASLPLARVAVDRGTLTTDGHLVILGPLTLVDGLVASSNASAIGYGFALHGEVLVPAGTSTLTATGGAGFYLNNTGTNTTPLNVAAGAVLQVNGTLRNNWAALPSRLSKAGGGRVVLAGANLHSGGTYLQAGTLAVGHDAALGSGPLILTGGTLVSAGGPHTLTNAVNLQADSVLDTGGGDLILSGPLTNGAALVKQGGGTLTLAGLGVQTGTLIISNGAVLVHGRIAGALTVDAAGLLGGTGVVAGAVTQDGVIAPGAGIGTLTISNTLTANASAVYRFELGGTNAPTDYDRLVVSDVHTLLGTLEVVVTNGYVPASGDRFNVLTNSGVGGLLFGTFSSVSAAALPAGLGWEVQYVGTESASLVVTGTLVAAFTPYEQWAQSITNPALRGEQADADGDGYANLLEYSQGTDATNSADNAKLSLLRTNGQFLVLFNRVNSATDIVYEVEGAYTPTNNATWLGIATNAIGSWGSSTNVNDNNTAAVHRVLVTDLLIGTNRSLRLKVTRP